MALSPQERSRRMRLNMLMAMSYAVAGRTTFTPLSLFSAGEVGAWYDPSDFSTMFQDSAGTTPVTAVEQPVGLVLDKSRNMTLGSELFSSFATVNSPWTASGSGSWSINGSQGSNTDLISSSFYTTGTFYVTTFTLSGVSGGTVTVFAGEGSGVSLGNGTYTYRRYATQAYFLFRAAAGVSATVSNVSVKVMAGNHASQTTSTSRPVLSARVNLLTYTEQFDNAAWTKSNTTVTQNTATAPDGTLTADTVAATTTGIYRYVHQSPTLTNGVTYTLSAYFKTKTAQWVWLLGEVASDKGAAFDIVNGTVGVTDAGITPSITSVGNGWFRCSITFTVASATGAQQIGFGVSDSNAIANPPATAGIDVYAWGCDLRHSNQSSLPYQRVGAATAGSSSAAGTGDYDTTGFPYYLSFDGVDDSLSFTNPVTGNTAFTGFVGASRTGALAGRHAFLQIGGVATRAGVDWGYGAASGKYNFSIGGIADLTGDAANFNKNVVQAVTYNGALGYVYRENNVQQATYTDVSNLAITSTGSVGARYGTASQSRIYSVILVNRIASSSEITNAETWVNSKTKAY